MPNCWWVETGHFSHTYRGYQNSQGHQSRWHVNTVTPGRKGARRNYGISIHNVIDARVGQLHHTRVSLLVPAGAAHRGQRFVVTKSVSSAFFLQRPNTVTETLGDFIRYGYVALPLWVFAEQIGVPIPAAPILLA